MARQVEPVHVEPLDRQARGPCSDRLGQAALAHVDADADDGPLRILLDQDAPELASLDPQVIGPLDSDPRRAPASIERALLDSLRGGDVPAAKEQLRTVSKKVDQAAAKKIVHRNRAARVKSRLSARIVKASKAGG